MMLYSDTPAVASIKASIATFDDDPPDSDFQRGYLAALRDKLLEVFEAETEADTGKDGGR